MVKPRRELPGRSPPASRTTLFNAGTRGTPAEMSMVSPELPGGLPQPNSR